MKWVFVHGAGGSADFWELQRPFFPDALFLNLPGHASRREQSGKKPETGQSAEPPLQSIAAYADWVAREVEQQSLDEVVLVGHSMGGAIALTVAMSQPSWLAGLMLSASAARLPVPAERLRLLSTDYPAAVDGIVTRSFATGANRYRVEGVRRHLLRTPPEVVVADYLACSHFDCTTSLLAGHIRVPTIVICGALDLITPPEQSRFLSDNIARAAFSIVEGAGHMAPLEQPEAWAATVAELWELFGD